MPTSLHRVRPMASPAATGLVLQHALERAKSYTAMFTYIVACLCLCARLSFVHDPHAAFRCSYIVALTCTFSLSRCTSMSMASLGLSRFHCMQMLPTWWWYSSPAPKSGRYVLRIPFRRGCTHLCMNGANAALPDDDDAFIAASRDAGCSQDDVSPALLMSDPCPIRPCPAGHCETGLPRRLQGGRRSIHCIEKSQVRGCRHCRRRQR